MEREADCEASVGTAALMDALGVEELGMDEDGMTVFRVDVSGTEEVSEEELEAWAVGVIKRELGLERGENGQ